MDHKGYVKTTNKLEFIAQNLEIRSREMNPQNRVFFKGIAARLQSIKQQLGGV